MKKVLIISINAIGDTYLSLSCINPINNFFENVEYTIICMKEATFLPPVFNINNVMPIEKKNVLNILKLYRLLRNTKYDYCFSFFPGRLNSLITMLSRAKEKYYYRNYIKLFDWYKHIQYVYYNKTKTKICWTPDLKYLDRVRLILDMVIKKDYVIEKPRFHILRTNNSFKSKYVVINFSSKEKSRELNNKFINEVSCFLFKEYKLKIVVIDYNDKYENVDSSCISIYNNRNFCDTLDLLLNAVFVITVDSFLIHIVDAYQIPSLCIFGPTNPYSVVQNYGNLKCVKNPSLSNINLSDISDHFDTLIKE